jgi:hypothetical protein
VRAPEWQGWLVLGTLIVGFGVLAGWLYGSRLGGPSPRRAPDPATLRQRRLVALLMLVSGTAMMFGARWDELWHRMYGGFGDDFLWPPHLLMYVALGLNGVFAGVGLTLALRGQGGLRDRFRAEPVLGLVGLLAAYQLASIPSDALWHEIIGPDLTAWSMPHTLLTLSSNLVTAAGAALVLSTVPRRPWRSVLAAGSVRGADAVALGLIVAAAMFLLQFVGTEWEWVIAGRADNNTAARPDWAYPLAMLAAGVAISHIALHATRLAGAATAVALASLVIQATANAVMRAYLPPGPLLVSHLVLLLPAVALDLWYARRAPRTTVVGGLLYAAAFCAVAFPRLEAVLVVPALDWGDRVAIAVLAAPVAIAVAWAAARFGEWMADQGTPAVESIGGERAGEGVRTAA